MSLAPRVIRREDGIVQRYNVAPPVTANTSARDAFNPRPERSPFDAVPVSPVEPDLTGARSTKVGWRSFLHVTPDAFVLERWTGGAEDYRVVPRTPDSEAAVRGFYREVFDD